MVAVKSKLKNIAYRPEVQQTDMTSVYETCQQSQMGYALTYHKKVQVGKDQEKAQSEKDSHSKNRGGKKPN